MIYLQRIFFTVSCIFCSFFMWNFRYVRFFTQVNMQNIHSNVNEASRSIHSDNKDQFINIKNDVLSLDINLLGGNIERADLLNFYQDINKKSELTLLNWTPELMNKAVSGILCHTPTYRFSHTHQPLYSVKHIAPELKLEKDTVQACIQWTSRDNIIYTKIFSLKKGSYNVNVEYLIQNNSHRPVNHSVFNELKTTQAPVQEKNFLKNIFKAKTAQNIVWSSDQEKYHKHIFHKVNHKQKTMVVTKKGWIALSQRYFLTAWIPKFDDNYTIYSRRLNDSTRLIGSVSRVKRIAPNSVARFRSSIWIGPKITSQLEGVAKNLELTIDYGFLRALSRPLFRLLTFFYLFFHNWGVTIIFMTFFIKMMVYPLIKLQYTSVLRMNALHPKIKKIKDKYSNDSNKIQKKILSLYQFNDVNPFYGFFLVLVQMPIFLAFYHVLLCSVELRHAPFFLWIKDLSSQDPHYLLPIFAGLSILFAQLYEPKKNVSRAQKIFSLAIPFLSTAFFLTLPSGLVLYYITNNWCTFFQHWFIRWNFVG
ncbi:membrane protein insertase YidC [Buchnera aphidicola]|uniref:membrane protein insertase YidC n=1 Tax=Buchnera aphidicola TaxID=9 RepID=UPI000B203816|nr:membrane protein insertase YidC [Buchnera aphidicola]